MGDAPTQEPALGTAHQFAIIGGVVDGDVGPIVGSIILWAILAFTGAFLREATSGSDALIPSWLLEGGEVGVTRLMMVGLMLVLLMAFRPQGMFGKREEMALDAS